MYHLILYNCLGSNSENKEEGRFSNIRMENDRNVWEPIKASMVITWRQENSYLRRIYRQEMQHVYKLYLHDRVMPKTLKIEISYNICVPIQGAKNRSNSKAMDVTSWQVM